MNTLMSRNKKLLKVKVVTMDADLNSITIEVWIKFSIDYFKRLRVF